ncbi:MAG: hypothetical protein A2939_01125 [Parcubacteria group bacterium RIFCSPLOWO2_01_FULL_48_18]|nr:MAG: hypothetical protein A2939_01125 [Parcubacteria group bacterium RIFCSPLOWO2_01_FULL_48_18]OHB24198.1 MAG: hypothetical protein A3J67_02055 [Parcubacteria group bacterium RIFCSPHIGHO2_02_FULL_48_10b]
MFSVTAKDLSSKARAGILQTPHGEIGTPAYIIVGTSAEVRTVTPEDLLSAGTQIVIANAYHLAVREEHEKIRQKGGLHIAMGWNNPLMTDSGGFQVFSLGAGRVYGASKIGFFPTEHNPLMMPEKSMALVGEEGIAFSDRERGSHMVLTPEKSIRIQEALGADIIYALDECTSPFHDYEYTKASLDRTHRWAIQCLEVKSRKDQQLWGIIQGGYFRDLREKSAYFLTRHEFEGIGIGGAMGTSKQHMREIIDWIYPSFPKNKPRHLLGIGNPVDILNAVEQGIDLFDCVIPTREARHGSLWTTCGRINIRNSRFKDDNSKIDEECRCATCQTITRKQLRTMFCDGDLSAGRLATIHNISFFNDLMRKIRKAIQDSKYSEFKAGFILRFREANS